jgi:hypothetical protein
MGFRHIQSNGIEKIETEQPGQADDANGHDCGADHDDWLSPDDPSVAASQTIGSSDKSNNGGPQIR